MPHIAQIVALYFRPVIQRQSWRDTLPMNGDVQDKGKTPAGHQLSRSCQTGTESSARSRAAHQAATIYPLGLLQKTKSISQLSLAAYEPKSPAGAHAKTTVCSGSCRTCSVFAPSANLSTKSKQTHGTSPSFSWHNPRWQTLCRSNQGKPAHETTVSHILLPLGEIKKTLRRCVVYKPRGREFSSNLRQVADLKPAAEI